MYSTLLLLLVIIVIGTCSGSNDNINVYQSILFCGHNSSLGIPLMNLSTRTANASFQNLTLSFCSGSTALEGELDFSNKLEVSFIGEENTILTCSGMTAGISFMNVSRIVFQQIVLRNCGKMHAYNFTTTRPKILWINFSTCILIHNSSEITVTNTSIENSRGQGMVVYQSFASINIENCTFENGTNVDKLYGGGGLYVQVECYPNSSTFDCDKLSMEMYIVNVHFRNNNAGYYDNWNARNNFFSFANGGGLNLNIKGSVDNNKVEIRDCSFESNSAILWGGGLNIVLGNATKNNNVSIFNAIFHKNRSKYKGGGGADIGFLFNSLTSFPKFNMITFVNSTFEGNYATFGGGIIVYSTTALASASEYESNEVIFLNCTWHANEARYASAVYFTLNIFGTFDSSSIVPRISLSDCVFDSNRVTTTNRIVHPSRHTHDRKSYNMRKRGKGCLFSNGYNFIFNSSMQFTNNTGTALYLASSIVRVTSGNNISFVGNSGYFGGAVSLFGRSVIHIHDNVTMHFENNTATVTGGAIYQEPVDSLEYISLKSCFFHYFSPHRVRKISVTCTFKNNTVSSSSHGSFDNSIFMYIVQSCKSIIDFTKCVPLDHNSNSCEYTGPIARFIFRNSMGKEIKSAGTNFRAKRDITGIFPIIPGKLTELPIEVIDNFDQKVLRVYQAILSTDPENHGNMSLDPAYMHIYDNKIILYGSPGDKGNVSFSLSSVVDLEIVLSISLQNCPPGYILAGEGSCICSSYHHDQLYFGISGCNQKTVQAKLKRGYWLGYGNTTTGGLVLSSVCPRSFCGSGALEEELYLPNSSSVQELDDSICGKRRTGALCSECRENYSVSYHSEGLTCIHKENCKFGWLIYLASEILPVTAFFLIVTVWDVQFTTGSLQGFVLYAQLFDTLLIIANGQIPLHRGASRALLVLKFFVNIFNMEFFVNDHLSFCLWENASNLDVLTFKYVTVVYAFSLVLVTVIILSHLRATVLEKCLKKIRVSRGKVSSSIIHGLSGFLVICYSQCTKTSLLILTPVNIYSTVSVEKVAFFDGQLRFLNGRHLMYAIPAILFSLTVVILPPILFITYPLCYRVLSLLRIEESKFTVLLCRIIPLEKLKPFFDSFQSCFKDEYRYFSGLYFVYRLSTLVTLASLQNMSLYYSALEIQLLLMLAAHAWVQPYRVSWHNKLDTFLFAVLVIVNTITFLRYNHSFMTENTAYLHHIENVQLTIAYLPLLYIVSYIIGNLWLKLRKKHDPEHKEAEENLIISLSMFNRKEQENEFSCEYKKHT